MPKWDVIAKLVSSLGLSGFIILYLLGAIPGLPSPWVAIANQMEEHNKILKMHADDDARVTWEIQQNRRLLRAICRGVWQGNPIVQREACSGDTEP
jgi:hypothetical protein